MRSLLKALFVLIWLINSHAGVAQTVMRKDILLNDHWRSVTDDHNKNAFNGFESIKFKDDTWKKVSVPHNWDQYEGYRRMLTGNRHGYAWYRKSFSVKKQAQGKRFFLYFEGVGSYATVWLNGKKVGQHAGGRTTFSLDVTAAIARNGALNTLAVRADHPANIQDLPWVDGGGSTERGFSEGSQPMGIFRPVHLLITDELRIEPFGVHVWNDDKVSEQSALLKFETEIKNYGQKARKISIVNQLLDCEGKTVAKVVTYQDIKAGQTITLAQSTDPFKNVKLWSLENPYLYQVKTNLLEAGNIIDEVKTPYGIRWISWPIGESRNNKQFLLNGVPVFINGIAEYEHLIGQSHAFSPEQIRSRVMQVKALGFNAFRDAHQPHNLAYNAYWDQMGILCWTQMAAHIWYDTPEFRKNFKALLTDWVKERRNSPSVVLWGLENESTLPEDFAKECTALIRSLDPTASGQRKVTTCNGGKGTDWDVPQNWTGTYGGNPLTYGEDLKKQVLVGEYGAWRTIDLHTEGPFIQNGVFSENNMTQLMETKIRLAESVKKETAGHFFWLFNSHDNPGRTQGGEGLRELDRVGPVNYKGLFTPWEEPLDVYYLFRSNYASNKTDPMVYLVSHTWPERWLVPGKKDSITVYSNCDEVELFNDVNHLSLGRKKRNGIGTHFQWDAVNIQYNVLYAVGYVNGKAVAKDYILLNNLAEAPHFNDFKADAKNITAAAKGYNYIYRINCGGPAFQDGNGQLWSADRQRSGDKQFGSTSWTVDFPGIPSFFASQRRTFDPIKGTSDWKLFQTFRFGRDKLKYYFPVPDGEYLVELYFIEPWLGTGGGMNCEGMRLFDVAVNEQTMLKDIDLWKEAGHDSAIKKSFKVFVKGGQLEVSFPQVKAGQALISAISIASLKPHVQAAEESNSILMLQDTVSGHASTWMEIGDQQYADEAGTFVSLPSNLNGSEWIQTRNKTSLAESSIKFKLTDDADVFVGISNAVKDSLPWMQGFENTKTWIINSRGERYKVYRKRFLKGAVVIAGPNASNVKMYTLAVSPVTKLEPAHDLKTITSYPALAASFKGPDVVKESLLGKDRVTFKKSSGGVLEWLISVGVADNYSLTIKYRNPFSRPLKGRIEFLASDGTLMNVQQAEFAPSKEGKWNYFITGSGSMINAGAYKVRLITEDAASLSIDALDVQ